MSTFHLLWMLTVLIRRGTNYTHEKEANEEYFSKCKMVYVIRLDLCLNEKPRLQTWGF